MPTYEYECKSCLHKFEVFQSMSDLPLKDCPEFGKEIRRLIFGGAGVIFKGPGFYVTDKAKSESAKKTTGKTEKSVSTDAASCAKCPAKEAGSCAAVAAEPKKTQSEAKSA